MWFSVKTHVKHTNCGFLAPKYGFRHIVQKTNSLQPSPAFPNKNSWPHLGRWKIAACVFFPRKKEWGRHSSSKGLLSNLLGDAIENATSSAKITRLGHTVSPLHTTSDLLPQYERNSGKQYWVKTICDPLIKNLRFWQIFPPPFQDSPSQLPGD